MFFIKRIYDTPSPSDGKRYLIDRVWPRGVAKETAMLDGWLKNIAPSTELRVWFNHEHAKWEEFKKRYSEELSLPEVKQLVDNLRDEANGGRVTLLYASKDKDCNNAVFLKEFLGNS